MEPWYFEDYKVGARFSTLARTVTETDLVNFIGLSGMYEPLFVDQEYLRRETSFTGRLVPGALTFALSEGLVLQTGVLNERGIAFLGAEITILKPVYVGDTVRVEVEPTEARPTNRPGRGIVVTRNHVLNQRGEEVMTYVAKRMVHGRPAES